MLSIKHAWQNRDTARKCIHMAGAESKKKIKKIKSEECKDYRLYRVIVGLVHVCLARQGNNWRIWMGW